LYPAHFKSYQLPALQKRVANIGGSKTQVMVCDIDESTPLVEHTSAIMGILENGFYSMAYSQDSQESLFDSKLEFIHSKSEFNLAKELTLLCHGNEVIAIPFGVNDYIDGDRNVIDRILNPICNNNILVCAAGNDDDNAKNVFPACLPNVIVVSSADLSVANDVSGIDLALQFPGANIEAGTWVVDGTSFACAQAAGYIALALRLHPSFSASAIFTKITGMRKNYSRYGCDVNTDILLESNY
jgi:subtilisin family serine protease